MFIVIFAINVFLVCYSSPAKDPPSAPQTPVEKAVPYPESAKMLSIQKEILESGFGLGGEISHIKYYDELRVLQESGVMFGVYGNYVTHPGSFMFKLDVRLSFGSIEHQTRLGKDNVENYIFEPRFTFGYDYKASEKAYLTPFVGIGYMYTFDVLKMAKTSSCKSRL